MGNIPEEVLLALAVKGGGSGGGGTSNYEDLENKPKINGETLSGNKSASDLGLASADTVQGILDGQGIDSFSDVETALADKVDKVQGKGLSTNDYDDTAKAIVDGVSTALNGKVDKVEGKGLSENDYTDADKAIVGGVTDALAGKQGTLTAGDYISIDAQNNISVNRELVPHQTSYRIKGTGQYAMNITKYIDGVQESSTDYGYSQGTTRTIDDAFTINDTYSGSDGYIWQFVWLKDSTTHDKDYTVSYRAYDAAFDFTEVFDDEDLSGYKLVIKSELDAAISSAYHHAGTKTCVELVAGLLVAANEGNVYNMTDSGTTTADFIEGAGQPIKAGDNVGIAKISDGVYKFDLLSGFVDTTNFVQKSQTAGLLNNDGTVNTTIEDDIDSLKSGFTNLDNEVNGDSTVYPYADVITIEDAIPANMADCTVKIEPVQDLHGYDHPWVGGAGDNKLYCDIQLPYSDYGITITSDNNGGVYINGKTTTAFAINGAFKTASLSGQSTICKFRNYEPEGGSVVYAGTSPSGSYYAGTVGYDTMNDSGSWDINLYFPNADKEFDNLHLQPMVIMGNSHPTEFIPYTNICPISGHTEASVQRDGVNLFDRYGDGYVENKYLNYKTGEYTNNNNWSVSGYINNCSGKNITITGMDSLGTQTYDICFYDKDKNFINGITTDQTTVSIPVDAVYIRFDYRKVDVETIQLELGSSATDYEPYQGKTYTIALGDTIYGGTVNFDSGVMTVDRAIIDLGQYDYSVTDIDNQYFTTISPRYKTPESLSVKSNWICDSYDIGLPTYTNSRPLSNYTMGCFGDFSQNNIVFVRDPRCSSAAEMKTALNGVQLCYELATPTTIQLTPQQIQLLKGTNTLTASTGQISVTVNGVSGAIGSVQEQVNDIASDKQDKTDNALNTTAKTVVGGINELKSSVDGLTANQFATYEDISSYTADKYQFDNDGYVLLATNSTSSVEVRIYGRYGNDYFNASSINGINVPVYVRKGMRLLVNSTSGTSAVVRFYPLEV